MDSDSDFTLYGPGDEVQRADPPEEPEPEVKEDPIKESTFLVQNLNWWVSEDDLKSAIEQVAPVTEIKFDSDVTNGKSSGKARVTVRVISTEAQVLDELKQLKIEDKPITIGKEISAPEVVPMMYSNEKEPIPKELLKSEKKNKSKASKNDKPPKTPRESENKRSAERGYDTKQRRRDDYDDWRRDRRRRRDDYDDWRRDRRR